MRQGNMTQMEKSLNKGELKDFKTNGGGVQVNAMIPGIFNESPLRHKVVPRKTYRELMRERSAQASPMGIAEDYNTDVMLPGQWHPSQKRAVSQLTFNPGMNPVTSNVSAMKFLARAEGEDTKKYLRSPRRLDPTGDDDNKAVYKSVPENQAKKMLNRKVFANMLSQKRPTEKNNDLFN